jgi:3'(2'), 5'-bisphosphate nucleotidase
MPLNKQLIISAIEIAKEAGEAISQIYNSDFDYQIKKDLSPITAADRLSHKIITKRLKILTPEIPILSEENCDIPFKIRAQWANYWLVDPLDGTKEFINNNGEFTVNIALIKNNAPILGIIHIPISHETYWGSKNKGSFYLNANDAEVNISVSNNQQNPIRIVASRSHPSDMLNDILEKIIDYEIIKIGSSIKFCHIASGQADCYPRFGPTSEWDTAAGEAIVRYAGGHMVALNGNLMHYNAKEDYLNPNFIVSSKKIISENFLSLINNGKSMTGRK